LYNIQLYYIVQETMPPVELSYLTEAVAEATGRGTVGMTFLPHAVPFSESRRLCIGGTVWGGARYV